MTGASPETKRRVRKPKFRVGEVAAFRHVDGDWIYDRIESIRKSDATAWLSTSCLRYKLINLRPLTKKERGR